MGYRSWKNLIRGRKKLALELLYTCDNTECKRQTNKLADEEWKVLHCLVTPNSESVTFHFCSLKCMLHYYRPGWQA